MLTRSEVRENASRNRCWVIINSSAYDLTTFVNSHPGGSAVILKYAGQDATEEFDLYHPSDTIEKFLKPEQNLGSVTDSASPDPAYGSERSPTMLNIEPLCTKEKKVKLSSIINLHDFEVAASKLLSPKSFGFIKSGAEDEYTTQWNRKNWQSIRFRPRVLRPIENIDISTTILGTTFSAPFFICPAGGGKLAHPQGDVILTKAAAKNNVLHWVCNVSSCHQEISEKRAENQTLYWQIYAMNDLAITEKEIKRAIAQGYKGFALTVDAVCAGKRERDMRSSIAEMEELDDSIEQEIDPLIASTVKRGAVWTYFTWVSAIEWLRGMTDLPIVIKGIQSWEDALLCMHYGVHPWLSNHGGRQLDGAPSAVETLLEIKQHCPEVFTRCEVIVDGGVTRGCDIVKALALGAKGVGLGRGFLYSMVFGEAGVNKAMQILKQEIETAMALLGVTSVHQLNASYVTTSHRLHL